MAEEQLAIIYSDAHVGVVEKPGGLLAVPGRGPDKKDSVVSRFRRMFTACPKQPAVHRLDQATSGLMLLAMSRESHQQLSRQFAGHQVKKKYIAVLEGVVPGEYGEIILPFRLDPDNRPWQVYDPEKGKIGITRWQKMAVAAGRTRVEFIPLTGRTHQLRLHAAHVKGLGCPIVGDSLYGSGSRGDAMLLHATELSFIHPATGKRVVFYSMPSF